MRNLCTFTKSLHDVSLNRPFRRRTEEAIEKPVCHQIELGASWYIEGAGHTDSWHYVPTD